MLSKPTFLKYNHVNDINTSCVTERLSVFCQVSSRLAEAPIWCVSRSSLFWVDILLNRLYEKRWQSDRLNVWQLNKTVSSLAEDKRSAGCLWLVSESEIAYFDPDSGLYTPFAEVALSNCYRTNDGSVGPDGRYWFGTMLRKPRLGMGKVLSIGIDKRIRTEITGIAIPNTFCWMPDGSVLISDSLRQMCQRFKPGNDENPMTIIGTFIEMTDTSGTPDGGVADQHGNIWIAIWGGGKVACYNQDGTLLDEVILPVLQPSSCCFGGPENNMLFITTATEGLSIEQLNQSPNSGKTFVVKLAVTGAPLYKFSTE